MKKLIIFFGLILFTLCLSAQRHGKWGDMEEFRTKKITFMTDKLQLTPEEAQQFWPFYNEFDEKRFEHHRKKRELEKEVWDNYETYPEEKFREINDKLMALHLEQFNLTKEYYQKFLQVLPAKKVVAIESIENDFRFHMIREFRKRKDDK